MAKYVNKISFSIVFCSSVDNSNDKIQWTKLNFMLPGMLSPPLFKEVQNTFTALDTRNYSEVLDALGILPYFTSKTEGVTDTRYDELALTSDLIYYIK